MRPFAFNLMPLVVIAAAALLLVVIAVRRSGGGGRVCRRCGRRVRGRAARFCPHCGGEL